jgi:PAS domain S-box-containing protein
MALPNSFGRDDLLRLQALEPYQAYAAAAAVDRDLEDLVRLAADICLTPMAGIAFVGSEYNEVLIRYGPGPRRFLRENTPCDLCIRQNGLFEVQDACYDPMFRPDGILLGGRTYRFYAGAPLATPDGFNIGTLFVQALAPQSLTPQQKDALLTLARQVVSRFELNLRDQARDTGDRDRLRFESALTIERNFVSTVLDTVGALVAVFDTAGRIVRFNRTCELVSGYDFNALAGQFFWNRLIPEEEIGDAIDRFERLRDGEFPANFENNWRQPNGTLRRIAWSATALLDEQGSPSFIVATGIDVTEQRAAEEKLRALIHQSNSILESVGDGIYGIDLNGSVTVLNPAASQMLGYRPDELLGRNLHAMIHHSRPDGSPYLESDCAISQTIRTGATVRVANEVFWRKDGSSFPVEYVARPQIDSQLDSQAGTTAPRPVGVVVAFRDTTERRALDRMKDEFISTVSHELRTPLTSLRAALGLVTSGALDAKPEKKSHMLTLATASTDRLIKLVNDFLDIERISSGNAELHSAYISAAELFARATSLQQASATKSNLRFDLQPNNVQVYADPDRILQALSHLISNAIKFSPPGRTIYLSAHPIEANRARFTIQDEGRGIQGGKLETIFERFQQADASDTRAMGGTGLGLAICRSIVAQHGGKIWATSPPGHGAFFHLTLPTQPASHLR